jgi:hypothetical protein
MNEFTFEDFLADLTQRGWASRGYPNISIRWFKGGIGGGDCYGGVAEYPRDGEPEPEFRDLDEILYRWAPDLTHRAYKELIKTVVVEDSDRDVDYYGNSSSYGVKSVDLQELFAFLKKVDALKRP